MPNEFQNFTEYTINFIYSLGKTQIGENYYLSLVSFLGTTFCFKLVKSFDSLKINSNFKWKIISPNEWFYYNNSLIVTNFYCFFLWRNSQEKIRVFLILYFVNGVFITDYLFIKLYKTFMVKSPICKYFSKPISCRSFSYFSSTCSFSLLCF